MRLDLCSVALALPGFLVSCQTTDEAPGGNTSTTADAPAQVPPAPPPPAPALEAEPAIVYEVLREGDGPSPRPRDRVRVHYEVSLLDGTVFDSSYDRGRPSTFPLGGVVPGFAEGITRMRVGGKARIEVPPELGYGDRATGPIPADSTLIFVVELIEIL